MKNYALLSLLFSSAFLNGCGQTGPLYLPDAPPPIHVERKKPEPRPSESKETVPAQETPQPTPSKK